MIDGFVATGFERVRDAFCDNFRKRDELGAALAVYRGGECLVDLWGGIADHAAGAQWKRDTVVLVFSTTKGVAAMTLALANARGLFGYDETVAHYWPEFASGGKERITIRDLLTHRAGLAVIDRPLRPELLVDFDRRDAVLAAQRPSWAPGKQQGYHITSLGFYESALLRRCDPKHRSLSQYFADEIASDMGLDFWIGLPQEFDLERLARIRFVPPRVIPELRLIPLHYALQAAIPGSLTARALANPPFERVADLDSPRFWHTEHPSTIGIGDARSIARLYAEFASGGQHLGINEATLRELERYDFSQNAKEIDLVLHRPARFSVGMMKPNASFRFGSSARAYGSPGAGGSFGFADPDSKIGFCYVPNRMGLYLSDDPRERAVRHALFRCI